jgi:hypothetical protein
MSTESVKPIKYFSYHSDEPGCRANTSADLELPANGGNEQWIVVAPRRVVAPESEQRRAGGPLDIEVAEPLQAVLQKRLETSGSERTNGGHSSITRIKIVSVAHDVVGLGMGKAQANLQVDFRICLDGDSTDSNVVNSVVRNGPNINTLWHQPRGKELRESLQQAADEALDAIADIALHAPKN